MTVGDVNRNVEEIDAFPLVRAFVNVRLALPELVKKSKVPLFKAYANGESMSKVPTAMSPSTVTVWLAVVFPKVAMSSMPLGMDGFEDQLAGLDQRPLEGEIQVPESASAGAGGADNKAAARAAR
jgi:hypothetical protein